MSWRVATSSGSSSLVLGVVEVGSVAAISIKMHDGP
jgi:hypothetical protein